MPKASHFTGNSILGSSEWADPLNAARSLAYFCPECGDIWHRVAVTLDDGTPATWNIETVPCLRHSPTSALDWSRIPGTITDAFVTSAQLSRMWWGKALENLPPAVLEREFDRLLTHCESLNHERT